MHHLEALLTVYYDAILFTFVQRIKIFAHSLLDYSSVRNEMQKLCFPFLGHVQLRQIQVLLLLKIPGCFSPIIRIA